MNTVTNLEREMNASQRGMDAVESKYMQGDVEPATSSILTSNSKYLNNPYYRDAYIQQALRRFGHDLPVTYMVPAMVRAINEVTDFQEVVTLLEMEKERLPDFKTWLERRRVTTFDVKETERFKAGTLGAEIHAFLSRPGFEMQFMAKKPASNDLEYLLNRRVALHDIEHMVSGFGPNIVGEYALAVASIASAAKYFTPKFAQFFSSHSVWIVSAGMKQISLHYPHVMPVFLTAMHDGVAMGNALDKPLFMVEWEEYLDWPVEAIAKHFGFIQGPGAGWDWTEEAARG